MSTLLLSFLLGISPIIWLVIALTVLKIEGYKACLGALFLSVLLAFTYWQQTLQTIATAALEGVLFALWPVVIVIVGAMFLYNLMLHTKAMEVIGQLITSVSRDKRVLVLLVAWCFGGFMEGMAGFGTAVAIPASMLLVMGFDPLESVVSSLVANSLPTIFGSIGIPTITMAEIADLNPLRLSLASVIQSAFPLLLLPFFIIIIVGGGKLSALKGMGSTALVSGVSYLLPQFWVAPKLGPELVVLISGLVSLFVTVVFLKIRGEQLVPSQYLLPERKTPALSYSKKEIATACLPFFLAFLFLLGSSRLFPTINQWISRFSSQVFFSMETQQSSLTFYWINTPGVLIIIAAIIGGLIQGAKPKALVRIFGKSIFQMRKTIFTMLAILATAKVMGYSGMTSAIATLLVGLTGSFYPLVAPLIGAVGGFVTGSGSSSAALFGKMQIEAAASLQLNPYLLGGVNTVGAAVGKSISPQCTSIGASATNLEGQEGTILSATIGWTLLLLALCCIISWLCSLLTFPFLT